MSQFSTLQGLNIEGITAAAPQQRADNRDYELLSEAEKKLLIKTTGVRYRHVVDAGMTTSDLCYAATQQLLAGIDWSPDEIDLLVFVSQSADHVLPSTSIILQDRLGISKRCMAFDVTLGCSGYVYGLSIVGSMMSAMGLRRALLLAGDVSSLTAYDKDKSTHPLFGDAGTATAISFDPERDTAWHTSYASDGSGSEAIIIPHGGSRHGVHQEESFKISDHGPGIQRRPIDLSLNGMDVFNFSITQVPKQIEALMGEIDLRPEAIDYFIMHQANRLMNESIRKKLGFHEDQTPYSLYDFGNTSSASIPLTLIHRCSEDLRTRSLDLLMSGFGVGLSWGTVSMPTDKVYTAPVLYL